MSFPRYPEYSALNFPWLKSIPTNWQLKRIRHLLLDGSEGIKIGPFGSQLTTDMLVAEGYKVYGQENVIANDFSKGNRFINSEKLEEMSVYEIQPGDLLVTMMGTAGRCMTAPLNVQRGIMDSHLIRLRFQKEMIPRFVEVLVDSAKYVDGQLKQFGKGSIMHGLNSSIIKELVVAVPSLMEQQQILAFLDHETAKIDALIQEQQRLIQLLKEKRQAVISHAVTKGLDPSVPMKDSGVEWLGEVPEHWDICSLRRLLCGIEQGWSPECFSFPADQDQWGVLKAGAVNNGLYRESENKALPSSLKPRLDIEVREGDLIMCRASGSPELIGSVAYVKATRSKLLLSDKLFRLVAGDHVYPEYVALMLGSQPLRAQIVQCINGAEGLANNLSQASVKGLTVTLPPYDEQVRVVEGLRNQLLQTQELLTVAMDAVEVLQERRSALISAAVTGKIDVRNWQPPADEHAFDEEVRQAGLEAVS